MTRFKWTEKRKTAVELLAQGMRDADVAKALDTTVVSLWRWERAPEFVAAVEAEGERIRAALRAEGIANKQNRIDALNERWGLMRAVIAARATANTHRNNAWEHDASDATEDYAAAGAETGLMVHTITYLKDGRREEWTVDTGLLKEMREHEKQAAQELGQWTEKREERREDSVAVTVTHDFDFDRYAALYERVTAVPGVATRLPDPHRLAQPLDSA